MKSYSKEGVLHGHSYSPRMVQPSWEQEVNPVRSASLVWPTYKKWAKVSKALGFALTAQFGLGVLIIESQT